MANAILYKKNKAKGIALPDFNIYLKTTIIKTHGAAIKKRHIDQ